MINDMMYTPAEKDITPDSWVIIEVNHEGEQFQKILSGWSGGYLDGDAWRMSSKIKEIEINVDLDYFTVNTESGSQYNLLKSTQGLRMSNASIYNRLKDQHGESLKIVEL